MTKPQRHRLRAALIVVAAALGAAVSPAAPAAAGARPVAWAPCPVYSDEVLAVMVPPDRRERYKELLGRLECGTVTVPLDHADPRGRQITVALTRLPARGPGHRLGALALNPGGPGGSGYLLPVELLAMNDTNAGLNERYDLIGFDPRGVGYSTKLDCARPSLPPQEQTGPLTEAQARVRYDAQVAADAACGRSDPAFAAHLSTADVARDLDAVRAALGERRLSYFGVSWGTWLGVVYRTMFPDRVHRMFLDSVAIPRFSIPAFEDGRAAAAERDAGRFTAWLAERDADYGLGATADGVRATLTALAADLDAHPRRYTDVPRTFDGSFIALAAGRPSPEWPLAGRILGELRTATGPQAPPTLKEVFGRGEPPPPPAGLPERQNATMSRAAFCNEDASRLGFDAAWAAYQRRVAGNPLTGRGLPFTASCAGWPLPPRPVHIRPGGGALVLAGHRYESLSPYEWTWQTWALVGGRVYTVDDDVHGSVAQQPDCTADLVTFFATGRIDAGCPGVQPPR